MSLKRPRNPIYPRFTIEEYKENPQAVKKVNDAALQYLEMVQMVIEEKDILLKLKEAEITQMRNLDLVTLIEPLALLIGTTMFGFGVNFATSNPHDLFGWMLSFAGCSIQLLIIVIGVITRLRK